MLDTEAWGFFAREVYESEEYLFKEDVREKAITARSAKKRPRILPVLPTLKKRNAVTFGPVLWFISVFYAYKE